MTTTFSRTLPRHPLSIIVLAVMMLFACQSSPSGGDKASSKETPAPKPKAVDQHTADADAAKPDTGSAAAAPKPVGADKKSTPPAKQIPSDPPPIKVVIDAPKYARDTGPRIGIDEAHHNFHSLKEARTAPFVDALKQEGYRVSALSASITKDALVDFDVVVIINALHASNVDAWRAPIQVAFSEEEVGALVEWVEGGGRLLLVADHMPFGGAAKNLGAALGFTLHDAFAFGKTDQGRRSGNIMHRRAKGEVEVHPMTEGVDQVKSFMGQAFEAPDDASVLVRMSDACMMMYTQAAWKFDAKTVRKACTKWPIVAARSIHRGRAVVMG